MNAGLGLGLPSTFTSAGRRSFSTKTIIPSQHTSFQFDGDYLFPIPPTSYNTSYRQVSAETLRAKESQSYWSPATEVYEEDEEEVYSPEMQSSAVYIHYGGDQTPSQSDSLLSPLQLAAHAALHLLSPKGEVLAQATANGGFSSEDTLANTLAWAWLVPMVDTTAKRVEETLNALKEPALAEAPAMMSIPSISSVASSISLRTRSSFSSASSEVDVQITGNMARSHSLFSAFSNSSLSTAATSTVSVLERKRPITSSSQPRSTQVIRLRGSRSRANIASSSSSSSIVSEQKPSLAKRDSVRSQCASVENFTPTSEDWDVMMQPMEALPSPSATHHIRASLPDDLYSPAYARATLFEIWTAAEEADRLRRGGPSTRESPSPSSKKRVSNWVKRVRKSTSTNNLLKRMSKLELSAERGDETSTSAVAVEDPLAKASQYLKAKAEDVFEPREEESIAMRKSNSIDQVVMQSSGSVWAFLG